MNTKNILLTAISLAQFSLAAAQNTTTMKSINENAPVKCSKSIRIAASPEKVWQVLTTIDQWANWQTEISKPKLNGKLEANTTFKWKTGGAKIFSTLHTVVPHRQFGWTGKTFGMYAIHNWTLHQEGEFTIVSVDESMQGFLAGLFKKSFNKNLAKGMQTWLELLKKECEK
ncbi:MAG: SRPBCC family protein [Bacteroidetes bacterium]|nr:SRPBCC family protein [Bacteroidota bacterium]